MRAPGRSTWVVAAIAALALTATLWSASVEEPGSAFTEGGHGASAMVQDAGLHGVESLRLLSGPVGWDIDPDHNPARTLFMVIAPERPFRADEVDRVQQFLLAGGQVLVADDFGHSNSLTSGLGITFERVRLVQPDGDRQVSASMGGRELSLQFDEPTALRVDDEAEHEVVASSPPGSFLDRDGDGTIDAGDPVGSFPVIVSMEVGVRGGTLVAVADTGPFLEALGDEGDNREFREMLLAAFLPDGGRLVVDESRSTVRDPWLAAAAAVVGTLSSDPWRYAVGVVALGLFVVGMFLATATTWSRHRFLPARFLRRSELVPEASKAQAGGRGPAGTKDPRGTTNWTVRGRAALFGGVFLMVLGIMMGNPQATTAAAFLLLAVALSTWTRPPRPRVARRVSANQTTEDSDIHVDLGISCGASKRGILEVMDTIPAEFRLEEGNNWFQVRLDPDRPTVSPYVVRPVVRGPYHIGPLRVRSNDPFRLRAAEAIALDPMELLIHPRHDPLSRIPFQSKVSAVTLGPHLVNRSGDGSEFYALRDYATGDPIRSVNWKASARSKGLVVNQRIHESMSTITVFIDARAISAAGRVLSSPLNESCRAALSIAAGAIQARDKVRVFSYGDGVEDIAPGKGSEQIHRLSDALARLQARGATPFREALGPVLSTLRPRTPFVLVSGFEGDDSIADGLRDLRKRGVLPTVIAMPIATEPSPEEGGPPEPGAQGLLADHDKTIAAIRGMSVPVVPVVPGTPLSHLLKMGGA